MMEGLVLQLIDYGESDQIVRLFLREAGTLSAIAKGIKKSKHRFPHHLEPFRIYTFKLDKKPTHDLYWIMSADQVKAFDGIMRDIRKIALGNVIMEFILKGIREEQPHVELYGLVTSVFKELEGSDNISTLWFYSEIHIMKMLGFLPNFVTCLQCKRPLPRNGLNRFDPIRGGFICPACQVSPLGKGIDIGPEAFAALQFMKKSPPQAASRLHLTGPTREVIASFLERFTEYYLERSIKSRAFLKEVIK